MKEGDKVHYIPFEDCDTSLYENGIIKTMHPTLIDNCWVVYHCNNEWNRYCDYTGQLTDIKQLRKGWI